MWDTFDTTSLCYTGIPTVVLAFLTLVLNSFIILTFWRTKLKGNSVRFVILAGTVDSTTLGLTERV